MTALIAGGVVSGYVLNLYFQDPLISFLLIFIFSAAFVGFFRSDTNRR